MKMQTLTEAQFQSFIQDASLMKSDRHGPKVYRRPDEIYVKLFRQRRQFSLAAIWPYAERFHRNSLTITRRGFDTIKVDAMYTCPEIDRTMVVYKELKGELLHDALEKDLSRERIEQLAGFLAALHDKGIYFRSIHMNNIVLQPGGTLGLIDIADVRFRWHALGALRRVRNLCHLLNIQHGPQLLYVDGKLNYFLDTYLRFAKLGFIRKALFTFFIHRYIDPEYKPAI